MSCTEWNVGNRVHFLRGPDRGATLVISRYNGGLYIMSNGHIYSTLHYHGYKV